MSQDCCDCGRYKAYKQGVCWGCLNARKDDTPLALPALKTSAAALRDSAEVLAKDLDRIASTLRGLLRLVNILVNDVDRHLREVEPCKETRFPELNHHDPA